MKNELTKQNLNAAGMRNGCFAYALAAVVVAAFLALPGLLMVALAAVFN